jgi:CubicO group peptidase (beta-lactamase class C family)
MADTAFEVEDRHRGRLGTVYARGEDGGLAPFEVTPPAHPAFYGMGHALYSTAPDYMRFLRMFLNRGQLGARVLSAAAVERMLANHIGDLRVGPLTSVMPAFSADVDLFPGIPKTHSLGFLRVEQDVPGMRSAGAQGWAGLCNTHFWFDPARDVAGLIMTQSLPFADPRFLQVYAAFERAVYAAKG